MQKINFSYDPTLGILCIHPSKKDGDRVEEKQVFLKKRALALMSRLNLAGNTGPSTKMQKVNFSYYPKPDIFFMALSKKDGDRVAENQVSLGKRALALIARLNLAGNRLNLAGNTRPSTKMQKINFSYDPESDTLSIAPSKKDGDRVAGNRVSLGKRALALIAGLDLGGNTHPSTKLYKGECKICLASILPEIGVAGALVSAHLGPDVFADKVAKNTLIREEKHIFHTLCAYQAILCQETACALCRAPYTNTLVSAALDYRTATLADVSRDGLALQQALTVLKNDREVVLAAVGQNGRALLYASSELQGDREIVLAAVCTQYGRPQNVLEQIPHDYRRQLFDAQQLLSEDIAPGMVVHEWLLDALIAVAQQKADPRKLAKIFIELQEKGFDLGWNCAKSLLESIHKRRTLLCEALSQITASFLGEETCCDQLITTAQEEQSEDVVHVVAELTRRYNLPHNNTYRPDILLTSAPQPARRDFLEASILTQEEAPDHFRCNCLPTPLYQLDEYWETLVSINKNEQDAAGFVRILSDYSYLLASRDIWALFRAAPSNAVRQEFLKMLRNFYRRYHTSEYSNMVFEKKYQQAFMAIAQHQSRESALQELMDGCDILDKRHNPAFVNKFELSDALFETVYTSSCVSVSALAELFACLNARQVSLTGTCIACCRTLLGQFSKIPKIITALNSDVIRKDLLFDLLKKLESLSSTGPNDTGRELLGMLLLLQDHNSLTHEYVYALLQKDALGQREYFQSLLDCVAGQSNARLKRPHPATREPQSRYDQEVLHE